MNNALRMAQSRSMDARISMKISSVKDSAWIDRRETSFSGSYLDRSDPPRHKGSVNIPLPRVKDGKM